MFMNFIKRLGAACGPRILPTRRHYPFSSTPASSELIELVHSAMDARISWAGRELQATGSLGDGWKYPVEEIIFSGAFAKRQALALEARLHAAAEKLAVKKTHTLAVKLLCNSGDVEAGNNCNVGGIGVYSKAP